MTRPGAIRDERSAAFFDALRDGRLLLRRCLAQGHVSAPEVMFCAVCGSADLEWVPASGNGRVVSWTAIHSRPDAAGRTTVDALVGLVELDEGPWLLAGLLGADVRSGDAVTLAVVPAGDEYVYAFGPVV